MHSTPTVMQFITEIWQISLPDGCTIRSDNTSDHPYIESPDRSKSVYVHCHPLSKMNPAEAALKRCMRDVEVMRDMNRTFELINQWAVESDASACRGMDYLDESAGFRIVTHVIASKSWLVGGSFQDYKCIDYELSRQYFDPLIRSLQFNDNLA